MKVIIYFLTVLPLFEFRHKIFFPFQLPLFIFFTFLSFSFTYQRLFALIITCDSFIFSVTYLVIDFGRLKIIKVYNSVHMTFYFNLVNYCCCYLNLSFDNWVLSEFETKQNYCWVFAMNIDFSGDNFEYLESNWWN